MTKAPRPGRKRRRQTPQDTKVSGTAAFLLRILGDFGMASSGNTIGLKKVSWPSGCRTCSRKWERKIFGLREFLQRDVEWLSLDALGYLEQPEFVHARSFIIEGNPFNNNKKKSNLDTITCPMKTCGSMPRAMRLIWKCYHENTSDFVTKALLSRSQVTVPVSCRLSARH